MFNKIKKKTNEVLLLSPVPVVFPGLTFTSFRLCLLLLFCLSVRWMHAFFVDSNAHFHFPFMHLNDKNSTEIKPTIFSKNSNRKNLSHVFFLFQMQSGPTGEYELCKPVLKTTSDAGLIFPKTLQKQTNKHFYN